jgi:hypothetical protein
MLIAQQLPYDPVTMAIIFVEYGIVVIEHQRYSRPKEQALCPSWEPRQALFFDPHEVVLTANQHCVQPLGIRSHYLANCPYPILQVFNVSVRKQGRNIDLKARSAQDRQVLE